MSVVPDTMTGVEQPETDAERRSSTLPVFKLALEESRIAFDDLMAQPEKIRHNVGALLGFAAIGTSIFGLTADQPANAFDWVCRVAALTSLLGLVVCAAYVTFPRKLIPSMDAGQVVAWGDAGDGESEVVRNLAIHIEASYKENLPLVKRMFRGPGRGHLLFRFGSRNVGYSNSGRLIMPDPQKPAPAPPKPDPQPTRPSPARDPEYRNDPRPVRPPEPPGRPRQ